MQGKDGALTLEQLDDVAGGGGVFLFKARKYTYHAGTRTSHELLGVEITDESSIFRFIVMNGKHINLRQDGLACGKGTDSDDPKYVGDIREFCFDVGDRITITPDAAKNRTCLGVPFIYGFVDAKGRVYGKEKSECLVNDFLSDGYGINYTSLSAVGEGKTTTFQMHPNGNLSITADGVETTYPLKQPSSMFSWSKLEITDTVPIQRLFNAVEMPVK